MSTALVDVEWTDPPRGLTGLGGHQRALLFVFHRGRLADRVEVEIVDGGVDEVSLGRALEQVSPDRLLRFKLDDYLGHSGIARTVEPATIAVCTHERPDDLERCLEALRRLPDDGQEILVIDSGPRTDATRRVVDRFSEVRYVKESRRGLDRARNRALSEAQRAIVAFSDDDALPDEGWLRAITAPFADRLVQCVTGLTLPAELETTAQEWQERYSTFSRGLTRTVFEAVTNSPGGAANVGAGVNMALRREVVGMVGPFDEALDAGTRTCSGGDCEMFARILAAGYRIVYEPAALSRHRHRREWSELRQAFYGYGVGVYAAWTASLLRDRELGVLRVAMAWMLKYQLPNLLRALLRRRDSLPLDLVLAQLRGCLTGPWAYLISRREALS